MKKWMLYLTLFVVAGLIAVALVSKKSLEVSNAGSSQSINATFSANTDQLPSSQAKPDTASVPGKSLSELEKFEAELISKLRATYGARIQELNIQASLIKVKYYLINQNALNGAEQFIRIIRAAFPQHAASILSIVEKLEVYNDWLEDNQAMLADLSMAAQKGAVWQKRRELFGDDAVIIWSEEHAELSQKKTKMQNVIHKLDQSYDMSIDEKLYQLQIAISENQEGSVQGAMLNKGMLSQAFLNFDSVQQTLKQLPAEERQLEINDIRRQLGFDEDQIVSLQEKDEVRDARWENGLAYMSERSELVASMSEAELPEALSSLREKYFKHEAYTIQKEEESDFWRFKRPRKYGKN